MITSVIGLLFASILYAESEGSTGASSTTYSAAYEFYGSSPYPINSTGARLGYLINPESEIEFAYVSSTKKVLLSEFTYSEITLQKKNWLSPLIYWQAGIGMRTVTIDSSVALAGSIEDSTEQQATSQKHQAITVNFGIGTEIQITDNLIFGSDIGNLSAPVHWTERSNDFPENADDSEADPSTFPFFKEGLKTNFQLLRTFIKVRL